MLGKAMQGLSFTMPLELVASPNGVQLYNFLQASLAVAGKCNFIRKKSDYGASNLSAVVMT